MGNYGNTFNAATAAELRAERGRKQITIDELVKQTGLSKSAVLNYLNGKRVMPTPAFVELSRALGVSPIEIFERVEQAIQED